ncbi:lipoprotein LpqH, partial [Mycobacterium sp.]|uniref:lipoprotein LpqH n=1 Tax=Mycobacterium sp. TaxID=1785 RepID=UPI002CB345AB
VGCKSDGNVVKIHAGAIADNGNVDLKVDNGFMAEVVSGTQSQNVAIQYDKKNLWTIGPSVKKDGNTYTFNGEEMDSKKPYEMVVTCP